MFIKTLQHDKHGTGYREELHREDGVREIYAEETIVRPATDDDLGELTDGWSKDIPLPYTGRMIIVREYSERCGKYMYGLFEASHHGWEAYHPNRMGRVSLQSGAIWKDV